MFIAFISSFKRTYLRTIVKLKKYVLVEANNQDIPYIKTAYNICKRLIKNSNSTLLAFPAVDKRYIKLESANIYAIIETNNIMIINNTYRYSIPSYSRLFYRVTRMFDKELEKRRQLMENEIMANIESSLQKIEKDLKPTELNY